MSYLLTEIALEMLGYKFYDTNGIFHLTNFQNQTAQTENQFPDEPSLMDFIEQREPPAPPPKHPQQNGHVVKEEPGKATSFLSVPPKLELPRTSSSLNPRRTPAKALAKIVLYESDKICNQITVRIEKAMQKHMSATNFQSALAKCVNEELMKIMDDGVEMQKFREFLEESLRRIDKRPFEKYERTFGPRD